MDDHATLDPREGSMNTWQPFNSAPRDGSYFLAHVVDLVDEYDEDDRLIARAVPVPSIVIAHRTDIFGVMEHPYLGRHVQGRRWLNWHPLPEMPTSLRGRSNG